MSDVHCLDLSSINLKSFNDLLTLCHQVHPKTAIPNYAIYVLAGVACLVGIINIGSATAFNIILSIGISSLYSSYTITEALLLWRRVRGDIRKPSEMAGYT